MGLKSHPLGIVDEFSYYVRLNSNGEVDLLPAAEGRRELLIEFEYRDRFGTVSFGYAEGAPPQVPLSQVIAHFEAQKHLIHSNVLVTVFGNRNDIPLSKDKSS
jgi:hypothetical protein